MVESMCVGCMGDGIISTDKSVQDVKDACACKPKCKLIGTDGNVFAIIGVVTFTLNQAQMKDKAEEFTRRAFNSASYDDVLILVNEYVEVE